MELTVLGRYSPYPPAHGGCPSYLLTLGSKRILVDCGSGAISRLLRHLHWDDLSCVILSHLHGDHMSDMLVLRYAVFESQRTGKRSEPLTVYCPVEPAAERELLDYKGAFRVVPVTPGDRLLIGDIAVSFAPAVHSMPCLSMRFEHQGRVLVYSGDTEPNPDLERMVEGADLFLCEATYTERRRGPSHFTARDAGLFARRAGVKRLVITHFATAFPVEEVMDEVRQEYPGAIEAEEGVTYRV